ncbi:MAG: murein biosynthesis integral membrane protein MurJ, partial [Fimbriimonadales bacterium]
MQAPLGIFGQSLAIAVFPALTQFFAQKRMDMFRGQLSSTLRTVIYITVPISIVMIMMSPEIVTLLFQYGKFKDADTQAVAPCLQLFGFGVTAWCLHPVLMRGFFAVQSSVTPIVLGTITTALFVCLCLGLRMTALGYLALPLSSSISATLLAIMLMTAVDKKVEGIGIAGILSTLLKSLVAGLVMAAVLYAGLKMIPSGSGLGRNGFALMKLGGVGLVGAWIYFFVTRKLGMKETQYLDRAMARLRNRSASTKEAGSSPELPEEPQHSIEAGSDPDLPRD